jgi:hypothetical protein
MKTILNFIVGKYGKSVTRTLLAALSGYLIKVGIPDTLVQPFIDSAAPVVTGVILYLSTQLWSLADKKKNQ